MKNTLFTSILAMSAFLISAQVTTQLNANNVNATISDNGFFFNNNQNGTSGYEVPAGSGANTIFTGSFWFGANDVNGQLKLAAHQYQGNGQDYWWGPLARWEGQFNSTIQNYFGQSMWTVTKAQIDDHILNYQSSTYTMPADIMNWPAHGDTSIGLQGGMLPLIAPFVDVNNNGTYDPQNGDYPCIKGDKATFLIMNDKGGLHTASGGEPIGIQLHYMFYQYSSIPELENTTFVDIEVVNMGTTYCFNTRASIFLDTDLGNPMDDYIGTDISRNMVYTYNADNFDENNFGAVGYGVNPPAFGVKWLSHDLAASTSYSNGGVFPMQNPATGVEHYQAMIGNYQDGSDQLDDMGTPTDHTYFGDPNLTGSWSEFQQGNTPGDRRLLASVDIGDYSWDNSYGAALRERFSVALVYAKGTDHLNSVTELQNSADFIQSFYDGLSDICFNYATADIPEQQDIDFVIAPNPNNGMFTVEVTDISSVEATVYDMNGRVVYHQNLSQGTNNVELQVQSGIYYLTVSTNNTSRTEKLIIQ